MAYIGSARFYIIQEIAGRDPIVTSDYARKSPFAIVQRDWRVSLPELARKYPGRADSLEIDCHGSPGVLFLHPELDFSTLTEFAFAARGLIRPLATIEFLACHVANYDYVTLLEDWKLRPSRKADYEFLRNWWLNSQRRSKFATLDHARAMKLVIGTGQWKIGERYNGPLFCSRIAQALRSTVRAAMSAQPTAMTSGMGLEEFLNTPGYRAMPIGNWSGHVFEFSPSGDVKWLGYDLPRPVYVPFLPGQDGPVRIM